MVKCEFVSGYSAELRAQPCRMCTIDWAMDWAKCLIAATMIRRVASCLAGGRRAVNLESHVHRGKQVGGR